MNAGIIIDNGLLLKDLPVEHLVEKPIANSNPTFKDEDGLVYLTILILDSLIERESSRLEVLDEVDQEMLKFRITDVVEKLGVLGHGNPKVRSEEIEEVLVKIIDIDLSTETFWELVHKSHVFFSLEG